MNDLLNKMIRLDIEINLKTREIEKWRGMRERITTQLQENKAFVSGESDKLGELTACILDTENELIEDVKRATEYRKEFECVLDKIDDPRQYDLMYRRYVLFQPWGTIAKEMHYSKDGVMKMHNRILQDINI